MLETAFLIRRQPHLDHTSPGAAARPTVGGAALAFRVAQAVITPELIRDIVLAVQRERSAQAANPRVRKSQPTEISGRLLYAADLLFRLWAHRRPGRGRRR